MRAVTANQMRRIDRRAREEFGIPELILMEHAGVAVAQEARNWFFENQVLAEKSRRKGTALVLAGPGANGGDGFVAARHLDNWGIPVEVVLATDSAKVDGAARTNLEILKRLGVPIKAIHLPAQWARWIQGKCRVSLVIDALLGTGISGLVREPIRSFIQWINDQRCPVIAVDIPSGLCADTGIPCGVAVKSTVTVTCGLPKKGFYRGKGPQLTGRLKVADISLPRVLI